MSAAPTMPLWPATQTRRPSSRNGGSSRATVELMLTLHRLQVGLDHLALNVASLDELEQWVAHLDGCGVAHSGIHDQPYGYLVVFRDPDNIQLELFVFSPH